MTLKTLTALLIGMMVLVVSVPTHASPFAATIRPGRGVAVAQIGGSAILPAPSVAPARRPTVPIVRADTKRLGVGSIAEEIMRRGGLTADSVLPPRSLCQFQGRKSQSRQERHAGRIGAEHVQIEIEYPHAP